MIRVAVLIVTYNAEQYVDDCFNSMRASNTIAHDVRCFVVDNASRDQTCECIRTHFPEFRLFECSTNGGFVGGNNFGWEQIENEFPQADYLFLLNQDTIVDPDYLANAVEYLETNPHVGAAQSLLVLHPETDLINTAGNELHFLGFGLPSYYREPRNVAPVSRSIGYPSGAAVLLRAKTLREIGLFHPSLFLYLEDAELGLKLHLCSQSPHLCNRSIVYHKYVFNSTLNHYFYLERNRWWLIGVHYRLRTLCLLLPALVMMECGQFAYAISRGLFLRKLAAVFVFLNPWFFMGMIRQRYIVQKTRTVGDSVLLARMIGEIHSPHLDHWLIAKVANPFFGMYFRMLRRVVRW